jgi:hypothetical protein|tara:strand:+ start:144 stop:356 length:213 start_codon:yes stop_codon:yes gene_type:complete
MTNRTKIAHNATIYEVIETFSATSTEHPKYAELLRNNGIVGTYAVKRTNGRKIYMVDLYANGMTGNLQAI